MASSRDYLEYVFEQINLEDISFRPMMGEFIIYYKGKVIGGIYDDRLLVKKTSNNLKYNMEESIPYVGGKAMYLISEVDNTMLLKDIIMDTYEGLIG